MNPARGGSRRRGCARGGRHAPARRAFRGRGNRPAAVQTHVGKLPAGGRAARRSPQIQRARAPRVGTGPRVRTATKTKTAEAEAAVGPLEVSSFRMLRREFAARGNVAQRTRNTSAAPRGSDARVIGELSRSCGQRARRGTERARGTRPRSPRSPPRTPRTPRTRRGLDAERADGVRPESTRSPRRPAQPRSWAAAARASPRLAPVRRAVDSRGGPARGKCGHPHLPPGWRATRRPRKARR